MIPVSHIYSTALPKYKRAWWRTSNANIGHLTRKSKRRTWRFPWDQREGRSLSIVLTYTARPLPAETVNWGFAYPALLGVLVHNAPSHCHWENHLACCGKRGSFNRTTPFVDLCKSVRSSGEWGDANFRLPDTDLPGSPVQVSGGGRCFSLETGVTRNIQWVRIN